MERDDRDASGVQRGCCGAGGDGAAANGAGEHDADGAPGGRSRQAAASATSPQSTGVPAKTDQVDARCLRDVADVLARQGIAHSTSRPARRRGTGPGRVTTHRRHRCRCGWPSATSRGYGQGHGAQHQQRHQFAGEAARTRCVAGSEWTRSGRSCAIPATAISPGSPRRRRDGPAGMRHGRRRKTPSMDVATMSWSRARQSRRAEG